MKVAARNMGGDRNRLAQVAESLATKQCAPNVPAKAGAVPTTPSSRRCLACGDAHLHGARATVDTSTPATAFYVSTTTGADTNAGTSATAPFKTLRRAQTAVRGAGNGNGKAVIISAGAYYEQLVFTPEDSGSVQNPVVWRASGDGPVVVSGGTPIKCDWKVVQINNGTALSCSTQFSTVPQALFVNGTRLKRARYPNGDPLVPDSGFLHAGSGVCGGSPAAPIAQDYNVQVVNDVTGTVLSQGWVTRLCPATFPFSVPHFR